MTNEEAAVAGRSFKFPIVVGALTLLLLFAAWRIVSDTMANSLAFIDPRAALFWRPDDSQALVTLSQQTLTKALARTSPSPGQAIDALRRASARGKLTQAGRLAARALNSDPLAPSALAVLARVADAEGRSDQAVKLMALAGDRALRDPVAQGWLLEQELRSGEFKPALGHLDALLRTHPETVDRSLALLAALAAYPPATQPLADLVAKNPPWRFPFLSQAPALIANRSALDHFYAELQHSSAPPSQAELQPYLERLVKDGSYQEAHRAWARALSSNEKPKPGESLYNGDFRLDPTETEFGWRIGSILGADVSVVGAPGSKDRALRVEFSGARVDFQDVSHLLLLKPGTYRFSGQAEADSLQTSRGLWWRISCVANPDQSLGETELLTESGPWRPFSFTFNVPASGCGAQLLRLELPARIALEERISGEVSYKDLSLSRVVDHPGVAVAGAGARGALHEPSGP